MREKIKVLFLAAEPLTDKIVWQNGNRYTFRLRASTYMQVAMLIPAAVEMNKKRWAIECLFGDAKTRGLNLEDTRLVIPAKLNTLLALVALAVAWAGKAASVVVGRGEISRKTHGYRAKSWFRTGFDQPRKWVLYEPPRAIQTWSKIPTGFATRANSTRRSKEWSRNSTNSRSRRSSPASTRTTTAC